MQWGSLVLLAGLWQNDLLHLEEHRLLFNISSSDYLIPDEKQDFLDQFSASLSSKCMKDVERPVKETG